jgi:hypothetical protein
MIKMTDNVEWVFAIVIVLVVIYVVINGGDIYNYLRNWLGIEKRR